MLFSVPERRFHVFLRMASPMDALLTTHLPIIEYDRSFHVLLNR